MDPVLSESRIRRMVLIWYEMVQIVDFSWFTASETSLENRNEGCDGLSQWYREDGKDKFPISRLQRSSAESRKNRSTNRILRGIKRESDTVRMNVIETVSVSCDIDDRTNLAKT